MPRYTETLIIGAGPAGLTAGYLLTKAGRSVLIVEQDPDYVGGISRTVKHGEFLFDIGGHRFFSKSQEVVDLWNEILPEDMIDRPRLSRIFYGGRFYSYPLKAFQALTNLGIWRSTGCIVSYLVARATPIKNPRTFHDWVRNQFGERLFSIFFKTYTEKVWGMSCDEISADWAAQRIKGLDLGGAIIDALARSLGLRRSSTGDGQLLAKTLIESFRYPSKGPGMMWETAAKKTQAQGGDVRMNCKLVGLCWDLRKQLWTATLSTPDGTSYTHTAAHIISSAPLTELSRAIFPLPKSDPQAQSLRYRDFITVALIAKASATFPDNWVYIHDPGLRVGRVQNFLSWSPHMAPDGYACVGLEYFCFEGDGLWTSSDSELINLATKEIGIIGLVDPNDVLEGTVVRQPKAYPVYDDNYQYAVDCIRKEYETEYPTLHLVGRNGMHKYNNQDHAMMTAMLTVRNIVAGERIFDVWGVNEDAEYAEDGTSGAKDALSSLRLVPNRITKDLQAARAK